MTGGARPRGYLVIVETAGEEEAVYALCASKDVVALPLRAGQPAPAPALLEHWGVRLVSLKEARDVAIAAEGRGAAPARLASARHLVVGVGDCEREGRLFASRKRRAFRHCASAAALVGLLESARRTSVTVVANVADLPYDVFGALLAARGTSADQAAQVGFLAGDSPAAVRWSVLKALLLAPPAAPSRDVFVYGCPDLRAPDLFGGVETLWWSDLTPERVRIVTERTMFFAALLSHSNGVDGNLGAVILCPVQAGSAAAAPRRTRGSPRRPSEGIPSCVHSRLCQRDPEGKRHRLHPHAIRADVVLYDTCAGFLTAGAFALPAASLGLTFLGGTAAALITSVRKKASVSYAALVCRSLLYAGHPLGEVVRMLNRYQRSELGELPSFVLLGDPAFRLPAAAVPRPLVARHGRGGLAIHRWSGTSLALRAPRSAEAPVPTARSRGVLCVDVGGPACPDREWWILRQDRARRSERLAPPRAGPAAARFRRVADGLGDAIRFLEILHRGVRNVDGAANVEPLGFVIDTARSAVPLLDHVRQQAATRTWHHAKHAELRGRMAQAVATADALNRLVPHAWKATRQWAVLHHCYAHALDAAGPERSSPRPCGICGQRTTTKRSAHPDFPAVAREMITCIRCGVVADVPPWCSPAHVSGPHRCSPGDTIEERVAFRAELPEGTPVELVGTFAGFGSEVVRCSVEPRQATVVGGGRARVRARFRLRFHEDCPPGLYSFVLVGSALLSPIIAAKYVGVEPRDEAWRRDP